MKELEEDKKAILNLLKTKSVLKQNVFSNTKEWFAVLKIELKECIEILKDQLPESSKVRLKYEDAGQYEARLFIGSDVLIFYMHTNVFKFSKSNYVNQSSYIKNDPTNAYCGVVNIYN